MTVPLDISDISSRLENLAPGEHLYIPAEIASRLKLPSLYVKLSNLRARNGPNLRVHSDRNTHAVWIWHDPTPSAHTVSRPLNDTIRHLHNLANQVDVQQALAHLTAPLPSHTNRRSRGSIYCTLEETLDFLHIDTTTWETIPPLRQTQLRIETGIMLRNQRTAAIQAQRNATIYTSFQEKFGLAL